MTLVLEALGLRRGRVASRIRNARVTRLYLCKQRSDIIFDVAAPDNIRQENATVALDRGDARCWLGALCGGGETWQRQRCQSRKEHVHAIGARDLASSKGFSKASTVPSPLSKGALQTSQNASCQPSVCTTTGEMEADAAGSHSGASGSLNERTQRTTPHLPHVRNTSDALHASPASAPHSLDARATQAQDATEG